MSAKCSSCIVFLLLVISAGTILGCSQANLLIPRREANALAFHLFSTPVEHLGAKEEQRIRRTTSAYGLEAGVLRSQLVMTEFGRIWAFVHGRLICIANAGAAACAPRRAARESGVLLGVFSPPNDRDPSIHDFLVQGLVSDDVKAVTVAVAEHGRITVDVANNVFSISASKPIHVLQLVRNH